MEKLTLDEVVAYQKQLETAMRASMEKVAVENYVIYSMWLQYRITVFARRVLEAQAKGGKMVSPECTDKMLSDGIDAYCDCETSNQGDIEQWKAMHAAAPDMLEE